MDQIGFPSWHPAHMGVFTVLPRNDVPPGAMTAMKTNTYDVYHVPGTVPGSRPT